MLGLQSFLLQICLLEYVAFTTVHKSELPQLISSVVDSRFLATHKKYILYINPWSDFITVPIKLPLNSVAYDLNIRDWEIIFQVDLSISHYDLVNDVTFLNTLYRIIDYIFKIFYRVSIAVLSLFLIIKWYSILFFIVTKVFEIWIIFFNCIDVFHHKRGALRYPCRIGWASVIELIDIYCRIMLVRYVTLSGCWQQLVIN